MSRHGSGNWWCRSLENNDLNIARAIWWKDGTIYLLDQTQLPATEEILEITEVSRLIRAIRQLSIRGAPALGIAGAYGVLLATRDWQESEAAPDWDTLDERISPLREARPTAVNLRWAIDRTIHAARQVDPSTHSTQAEAYRKMLDEAVTIHQEDEERCRRIGEYGAELLGDNASIVTHCNTGALATGGIGTALGVIYSAVMHGKQVHVYADETRPLLQGARLTAWELQRARIPTTVMTDGMAASLMHQQKIDAVIVGADRIANNGDTANKIGTYQLAIAARAHQVPFYVAAPTSTIDFSLDAGEEIPIEMRGKSEVIRWGDIPTAPEEIDVYAPAFDVTPANYITAIITDAGIFTPPVNFREMLPAHLQK